MGQQRGFVISPVNGETVVKEDWLHKNIEFLSSPVCEGRASATPGMVWAAEWIRHSFLQAGLVPFDDCWVDGFPLDGGGAGHNVMGMIPGSGDEYVIIMSHYDNLGILGGNMYPGADSNASGVVAMVALTRMFRRMTDLGKSYRKNIIFVGLDGKNRNFSGAKALYQKIAGGQLKNPVTGKIIGKKNVSLVINIDQLGSTEAPLTPGVREYLIMLGDESYARRDLMAIANRDRRLDLELGFSYYGSKDFTRLFLTQVCDQKIFLEGKMRAVLITSGITMRNNKPSDTSDGIDYPVFRKRIALIFHWLSKWV